MRCKWAEFEGKLIVFMDCKSNNLRFVFGDFGVVG
jgi:hypothetical protein